MLLQHTLLTYEKVISFLPHFRPWMAYRFFLRLLFNSAPNLSGTPQRGRFMALPKTRQSTQNRVRMTSFMLIFDL